LVRHGETAWNKERRLQGQGNVPLSPHGVEQVKALVPVVRPYAPATVTASDLERARQTAEVLGYGDCTLDERLRETDLGVWTGLTIEELTAMRSADYHAWRAGTFLPEGAESSEMLTERVRPAIEELVGAPGPVLVIAHGGVVRAALEILLELDMEKLVPVSAGSLTVVDVPEGWPDHEGAIAKLHSYNLTGYSGMGPVPD